MALMSKAAIVTGAAQGIGKAIAARLVKDGMRVAIVDINQEAAVAAAEELAGQYGAETMAVQCDVSQEEKSPGGSSIWPPSPPRRAVWPPRRFTPPAKLQSGA